MPTFFSPICMFIARDEVVELGDVSVEEKLGSMANAVGLVEVEGAKLLVKVYSVYGVGKELWSRLYNHKEAWRRALSLARGPPVNVRATVGYLLGGGVASIVLYCKGVLNSDNGSVSEGVALLAPYAEGYKDLVALAYDSVAGRSDGLEPNAVKSIYCSLLKVAARLQELGVVHGDINPSNVLVKEGEWRALLTDFDGSVTSDGYPPLFRFNPEGGDLTIFDNLSYDLDKPPSPMLLDWLGVIYTGIYLGYAAKPAVEARRASGSADFLSDTELRRVFAQLLGETFLSHVEAALKGVDPPGGWSAPVKVLYDAVRREGVC